MSTPHLLNESQNRMVVMFSRQAATRAEHQGLMYRRLHPTQRLLDSRYLPRSKQIMVTYAFPWH